MFHPLLRRRPPAMRPGAALLLLLLCLGQAGAESDYSSSKNATTITTSSSSGTVSIPTPSVCPAQSINYLTHSLPAQCLTASWTSKESNPSSSETLAPAVNTTASNVTESTSLDSSNATETSSGTVGDVTESAQTMASVLTTSSDSAQTETSSAADATPTAVVEVEVDSALDNANFLSFEDWKKQNLAKGGQSMDQLGTRDGSPVDRKRAAGQIANALDALGEDVEIDIDFGGFVSRNEDPVVSAIESDPPNAITEQAADGPSGESPAVNSGAGQRSRPKDAGKTCKERTNYASYDCAATALKTNPECKSSSAILVENKDSYMLNQCGVKNKFFIVELCDNILVDTVVLANFEFFSSMFRTFRVSVSDQYPVKLEKWKELGVFEARNTRDVQAFLVDNPLIWARYLRVEILSHFGNEYYCPISLLRIHGTTMMEEFNSEMKSSAVEDEVDADALEVGVEGEGEDAKTAVDVVTAEALKHKIEESKRAVETSVPVTTSETLTKTIPTSTPAMTSNSSILMSSSETVSQSNKTYAVQPSSSPRVNATNLNATCSAPPYEPDVIEFPQESALTCNSSETPIITAPAQSKSKTSYAQTTTSLDLPTSQTFLPTSTSSLSIIESNVSFTQQSPINATTSQVSSSSSHISSSTTSSEQSLPTVSVSEVPTSSHNASSTIKSPTQPPASNPTTQESFFKSVHKRLQLLEANSTLSLQYIEEQSRILRDAFSKVEKRQLAKTDNFLAVLNSSVLTELAEFRKQYDQIWQSTVLELSAQREQTQRELLALSSRLSLLADEVVFQKRMAFLQFLLVLICFGLAFFSKQNSPIGYLELPAVVQNAINKSSANLARRTTLSSENRPSTPFASATSKYGVFRHFASLQSSPQRKQSPVASEGIAAPPRHESPDAQAAYSSPTPDSQGSPPMEFKAKRDNVDEKQTKVKVEELLPSEDKPCEIQPEIKREPRSPSPDDLVPDVAPVRSQSTPALSTIAFDKFDWKHPDPSPQ